jgi:hypothetical protein
LPAARAADISNPQARATFISIAVLYDELAIKAELKQPPDGIGGQTSRV